MKQKAEEIFKNGLAKVRVKDYENALVDFTIAIGLDPISNANYYNNRGAALSYLNRKSESLNDYNKAIEMDSNNSHFYYNRAETYAYFGYFKKAIKDYNAGLKINPNDNEARYKKKLAEYFLEISSKNKENKTHKNNKKIKIFISYSHKDEDLKKEFEKHLTALKRLSLIEIWEDRKILGSEDWEKEIDSNINDSDIIACLISSDFISSDYCYSKELTKAIQLHEEGKSKLLPIILRPVEWKILPISKYQALPKDAKPVTTWNNLDQAFESITKGILNLINELEK